MFYPSDLPPITHTASLSLQTLTRSPKETYIALNAIYARNGNMDAKKACVRRLLDNGFDINEAIDIDGSQKYLLDLIVEKSDHSFADYLVERKKANPNLCSQANQQVWFMDDLKSAYKSANSLWTWWSDQFFPDDESDIGEDESNPSVHIHIEEGLDNRSNPTCLPEAASVHARESTVPVVTAQSFVGNLDDMERGGRNFVAGGNTPRTNPVGGLDETIFEIDSYLDSLSSRRNFVAGGNTPRTNPVGGLGRSFVDREPERCATNTPTTQANNPAIEDGDSSACCAVLGSVVAGAVVIGGIGTALSALEGYIGARILHNYYTSYDPIEATRMGAIGGSIMYSVTGAICGPVLWGRYYEHTTNTNRNNSNNGNNGIVYALAGIVATGLIGYGVMNAGNSETVMNLGQTAAAFALGGGVMGAGVAGLACAAIPVVCCASVCFGSSEGPRRQSPVNVYAL